jgi:Outer membrane receptor for Fe3+-dicitrate
MKIRLFTFLLFLSCLAVHAQTGPVVYDRLASQREFYPLERVYVHTDAEDYFQGDRIWLKAYLMDEVDHTPVDSTLYLYAELFDKSGRMERQVKLIRRQGDFYGYLDIPEDMAAGDAYLRCYSRYMAAAPETAFIKRLSVGRGKSADPKTVPGDGNLNLARLPHGFRLTYAGPDPCYLIVLRGGEVCFLGGIRKNRPLKLPDDAFLDGPLEFLVVGREGEIVARQDYTLDRGRDRLTLPISVDKAEYQTGDIVTLTVDPSVLSEGELLDLSLSVTCRPLIPRHLPASITDYVLGRVSGFDFGPALGGKPLGPAEKESTAALSGTVRTELFNRPVRNARVSLVSPEAGMLDVAWSGADGRFRFEGLDYPTGTKYLVKSSDLEGRDRYSLSLDETVSPAFKIPENPYRTALDDTLHVVYADDDSPFGTIQLEAAGVSLTQDGPPPTGFNRNADYAVTLRQIEERGYTHMEDLLREVPGVFIREGVAYVRAAVSINADVPAAIAVDGTILDGEYDLETIVMPEVARVDVFKTGSTVIWGPKGGGGVISITTKTGVLDTELLRRGETVHQKVTPLGYQRPADFLTAEGYRNRRTVYWNPVLLSDSVVFQLGDTPGTHLVVVEGVTSEGRLIHEELSFSVSQ